MGNAIQLEISTLSSKQVQLGQKQDISDGYTLEVALGYSSRQQSRMQVSDVNADDALIAITSKLGSGTEAFATQPICPAYICNVIGNDMVKWAISEADIQPFRHKLLHKLQQTWVSFFLMDLQKEAS